jgi:CubicO group peptidase (beta-lactamase class C family)
VDPRSFAHPDDVSPAHLTTFGVIVDGVHYAGDCPTRMGLHPYCADIDLPSYSIAKSTLAALGLMRLERRHPGTRARIAADFVPECAANGTWQDVTFEHLLDMTSGHYLDPTDQADEMAAHADALFFGKTSHREKIDYACGHFPRKDRPGERWVYRTSDTYILGTAMTAYLSQLRGEPADIVDDLLAPEVWDVIQLSPTARVSRRTRDAVRQPFAGYGLTLRADDVARLARYLNPANVAHERLLDQAMLRAALQLDPNDRGLPAGTDGALRYNNGFWAVRVESLPGCRDALHVPFMSGFGGISVVLMPNGVSYYYFSDNAEFRFRRAIVEAARIRGYCQPAPVTSPSAEVASR